MNTALENIMNTNDRISNRIEIALKEQMNKPSRKNMKKLVNLNRASMKTVQMMTKIITKEA